MIYRKWSLLTGPTSILAGIVGTVIVVNYLFVPQDLLTRRDEKKDGASSKK